MKPFATCPNCGSSDIAQEHKILQSGDILKTTIVIDAKSGMNETIMGIDYLPLKLVGALAGGAVGTIEGAIRAILQSGGLGCIGHCKKCGSDWLSFDN